jgi:hypothetical protein
MVVLELSIDGTICEDVATVKISLVVGLKLGI